ncbi:MAG: hypothetical protein KDD62_10950, partial [Bdellovibrionales bacterium]|nr:hypothetical protein [Bdellovibrionales bacterium]
PVEHKALIPRDRSDLKGSYKKFNYIPKEEIQAAIIRLSKHCYGLHEDELAYAVCDVFGYRSIPKGADSIIDSAKNELIEQKILELSSGFLRINHGL